MVNDKGKYKKAGPSTAVKIWGLSDTPEAGDSFNAVKDDKIASRFMNKEKKRSENRI